MNIYSEVNQEACAFLDRLDRVLTSEKVKILPHWQIDHLCYRTNSDEKYFQLIKVFPDFSELLIESEVNGRLISTFKLNEPINFKNWSIFLIEITAPKKGKLTKEGFEHFEIVCDISFEELLNLYPDIKKDLKGLDKKINPDLEFCFGDENIKFHHQSLEAVIIEEINVKNNPAK